MKIRNGVLVSINRSKDIKRGKCIIPDNVTSIGEAAFFGCSGLTSVTIPGSVTSIGIYAFFSCSGLSEITIGNSVTSIGSYAFSRCSSLTSVTIGNSTVSIGEHAFAYCRSLTSITVSENNTKYKSIDGNLYSKDGTTLIQYAIGKTATSFIIPDSVTSIGERAFSYCCSLSEITIPNSVTSIERWAFYGCIGLKSVAIPNSVKNIGGAAFSDCDKLTRLRFKNNTIKAVKGFYIINSKLKCRDFVYEVGKTYKEKNATLCESGFHACTLGLDVFNYYAGGDVAYYEVELSGISSERECDSKICGKTITLLRELTVAEAANYRSEIAE